MDKTDRLRDYGLAFLLYEHGLGVCGYELIRELFIFVKLILNSYLGDKIMALAISGIPMLTGDEALAFRERAEETLKKRGSIDFSKQRAEMKAILAKAKF